MTAAQGTGWIPTRHLDIDGAGGTARAGYNTTALPARLGEDVDILVDNSKAACPGAGTLTDVKDGFLTACSPLRDQSPCTWPGQDGAEGNPSTVGDREFVEPCGDTASLLGEPLDGVATLVELGIEAGWYPARAASPIAGGSLVAFVVDHGLDPAMAQSMADYAGRVGAVSE